MIPQVRRMLQHIANHLLLHSLPRSFLSSIAFYPVALLEFKISKLDLVLRNC